MNKKSNIDTIGAWAVCVDSIREYVDAKVKERTTALQKQIDTQEIICKENIARIIRERDAARDRVGTLYRENQELLATYKAVCIREELQKHVIAEKSEKYNEALSIIQGLQGELAGLKAEDNRKQCLIDKLNRDMLLSSAKHPCNSNFRHVKEIQALRKQIDDLRSEYAMEKRLLGTLNEDMAYHAELHKTKEINESLKRSIAAVVEGSAVLGIERDVLSFDLQELKKKYNELKSQTLKDSYNGTRNNGTSAGEVQG